MEFADLWGINVETMSRTYAQSNGEAERFVQTVKKCSARLLEDGVEDLYIALLQYRNAPVAGVPYTPAEVPMSRRLRDKLPTARELLIPKVVHPTFQLRKEKRRQKQYYNCGARTLSPLRKNDVIRVQRNGRWEPVIVQHKHHAPRLYVVKTTDGGELRRNCRHLLHTDVVMPVVEAQPEPEEDWVTHSG